MSRVIKSNQFFIAQERTIGQDQTAAVIMLEQAVSAQEVPAAAFDAEQAQQIINETENMVTELLDKARQQAQLLMENARVEAEQIRQQSLQEVERAMAEAIEEGRRQGREQIEKDLASQQEDSQSAAQRIIALALQERERMLADLEPELVKLALSIARKIINAELETAPELAVKIAQAALQRINGSPEATIRVNPKYQPFLEEARNQLESEGTEYRVIQIEADPAVEPGGCIVDTGAGYVDAQISQQLKSLEGALLRNSTGGKHGF